MTLTLLQEYDIKSAEDIQETLKDLLGGTIQSMLEAEMDNHLGYASGAAALMIGVDISFPSQVWQPYI